MSDRVFLRVLPIIVSMAAVVAGPIKYCQAQNSEAADARVLAIQCEAKMEKRGAPIWHSLRAPQDVGLSLIAGDQIKCVGAGYLEILIPEGKKKITMPQGTFTIAAVMASHDRGGVQEEIGPKAKGVNQSTLIASELRQLGLVGATRGIAGDSRILWPSNGSAVVPEHFVILWTPVQQKVVFSILSETKDVTLWGPVEADGETGELKSDAVSTALADYKKKSTGEGLIVTLTLAKSDDWEEVHFSLLNGKQERELDAQLDFWAQNSDGLAARLGRGYSFSLHRLFAEAADEYDAALKSAPGSRYLLEDAIQANRLAGRASRVRELQSKMASEPGSPSP